jgi:DNA-binding NarL/FixJ family response regulator
MVQEAGPALLGVVHASRVIRDSTVAMLHEQPGMRVVRAYGNVTDVLAEPIAETHILLYDLATARQDGPSQLVSLHAQLPQARILMFNVMDDDQAIIECVRVGASGCVLQDATMDDLIAAIRSVAGGTPHSSPRVITSLFSYVAGLQAGEDRVPLSTLTPREEQILQLLAGGMSNKEIAQELHLQPQTVKNYVHLVLQKLDLRSRLDVIKLFRSGRR